MQFQIGIKQYDYEVKNGAQVPVVWDEQAVVNGHMGFVGKSGSGKSHVLRHCIKSAAASSARPETRFLVIDRHGDLATPGESVVRFSESTPYGFQPLEINPDPHFGGVRKAIQKFIAAINRTSHKLGPIQEGVLRRLLEDLYAERGYQKDDWRTWTPQDPEEISRMMAGKDDRFYIDVPWSQKDRAKELKARWDDELKSWWVPKENYVGDLLMWGPKVLYKTSPTLADAVLFTKRKLEAAYLGANAAVMTLVSDVNRTASSYHRLVTKVNKEGRPEELVALEKKRDAMRQKAVEAFDSYLAAVVTGRELDDTLHYRSLDVMTSVYDRLKNLQAIGIFRSEPPPFDPRARIWRCDIRSLGADEAQLFVHFALTSLYNDALQRGETKQIVDIAVLDEADKYFTDDDDNMPNVIAKEARKFGLNLWAVSQSVSGFSDAFLANLGSKVILALDPTAQDATMRKLKLEAKHVDSLRPRYNGLVHIGNLNDVRTAYRMTIFPRN
ncbi:DUF5710 domain-containing protein [Caballeronia sp. LP003]|uniref:DUF5710 domain-containing protein n=1 Tax=Caballeronia sp. LP003 TaxID=3038551 RepID=UPI002866C36F|nr:DUF5710 domain-containing protein [Caballeronia sp. LP003]MDR5791714.1 DUF5710 domain-containing protein [Caballeronia sp. LP003]